MPDYYWWYFYLNDELRDIGRSYGDPELGSSKPINSLMAVLFGGLLILPPYISVYRFGKRINRAEMLVGIPESDRINPVWAFLLLFPLGLLVIPAFMHYAMVTRHQDMVVRAAAVEPPPASLANLAPLSA